MLEAEAVVARFYNVTVVRQPVQQRRRHFRVTKYLRPLAET